MEIHKSHACTPLTTGLHLTTSSLSTGMACRSMWPSTRVGQKMGTSPRLLHFSTGETKGAKLCCMVSIPLSLLRLWYNLPYQLLDSPQVQPSIVDLRRSFCPSCHELNIGRKPLAYTVLFFLQANPINKHYSFFLDRYLAVRDRIYLRTQRDCPRGGSVSRAVSDSFFHSLPRSILRW